MTYMYDFVLSLLVLLSTNIRINNWAILNLLHILVYYNLNSIKILDQIDQRFVRLAINTVHNIIYNVFFYNLF